MQKILLAANALNLNTANIDFAAFIAKLTGSKIYGVLLHDRELQESPIPKMSLVSALNDDLVGSDQDAEQLIFQHHEQLLKDSFERRYVSCCIHFHEGAAVNEIIRETRFADMVITDAGLSFDRNKQEGIPSKFVKKLLTQSECPVIISPFYFNEIEEIVFAYDGSRSSVFAIKQFTYLFPQFCDKKVRLIQVADDITKDVFEKDKLKEWLMMYYNEVNVELLHGEADEELFKHLLAQKNKFLVMGAYGRNMLLHHSAADLLLKTLDIPIFIAHL